jgi:hypothetical protein
MFACAIINQDLLFTIYDIPSISICRGSQRKKAAENLGLPPSIFSDIEACGGHIPGCNALRSAELFSSHVAPPSAKRARSSLGGSSMGGAMGGASSGDLGLPSRYGARRVSGPSGSEGQPDPLQSGSQGGLLSDLEPRRGLGIDVISSALVNGSATLGDVLKVGTMDGSATLALLSSLQGQSLQSGLRSELLPNGQGASLCHAEPVLPGIDITSTAWLNKAALLGM